MEISNFSYNNDFVLGSVQIEKLWNEIKLTSLGISPVLLLGESGVGKSLFAYQIYKNSTRNSNLFVEINCAFFDDYNFFDCVKNANNGVLFLKEISYLPTEYQNIVLQLIQEKKIFCNKTNEYVFSDVKVIASSSKNLEHLALYKEFSEDLLFLLNSIAFTIPSLRERKNELESLSSFFLNKYKKVVGKNIKGFSSSAENFIKSFRWNGNIRELENVIFHGCICTESDFVSKQDLLFTDNSEEFECNSFVNDIALDKTSSNDLSLKSALDFFKKAYLKKILDENNWNQTKVSKILDVQRTYVSKLMKELHIRDEK